MPPPDKEKAAMQEVNQQAAQENRQTALYQDNEPGQADTWCFHNCDPKSGRCFRCKEIKLVALTPIALNRRLCEACVIFQIKISRPFLDGTPDAEIKGRLFDILLADLNPHCLPILFIDQEEIIVVVKRVNQIHAAFYPWAKGKGGKND